MKQAIVDLTRKQVGEIELSDKIFTDKINKALVYEVVKMNLANVRQGDAASKNRKLVSGSTKKIYRQKGTGRARHSDRRANIFVGGGKSFGPHPRDYFYSIPKKARSGALRAVLSEKQISGNFLVVDNFSVGKPKTKEMVKILKNFGVKSGLIVADGKDENLSRSVRNIPNMKLVGLEGLNIIDILNHEHLVVTVDALNKMQEKLKP